MRRIPQTDPRAGYLAQKQEIDAAVLRVLDAGRYILGTEVAGFEAEFARYLGVNHAFGVGNGTDALAIALQACGVGRGDHVLTVSHTAVATVAAIELAGAIPVLCDIEPQTFVLDCAVVNGLSDAWKKRIRAVVAVHLYGHPVNMGELQHIAAQHGWKVIEDCAQAHGAVHAGRTVGSFGDAGAFSFYPTKNLGAVGDGGAVATNDQRIAERVRLLREYGWRDRYVSEIAGQNTRLDEVQAAILRIKLRELEAANARRRRIAEIYSSEIVAPLVRLPTVGASNAHVFHQYVVRCNARERLRATLAERQVGTLVHYPVPVHLQPAYAGRIQCVSPMPETERAAREVLSLPMYPELSEADVRCVVAAVNAFE